MSNFSDALKTGLGRYMKGFHESILSDTSGVAEYASRPFQEAVALAPGRMIDSVQDMLNSYRKNDNSGKKAAKTKMPMLIVAVGKDFTPSGGEYGRGLADPVFTEIPNDPKRRIFKMRCAMSDVRAQIVILAGDEPTARSLATQLHLYVSAVQRRNFGFDVTLAGVPTRWPVQIENPDLMAVTTPLDGDVKNTTALTVDMTLRAWLPYLGVPKESESDGKGTSPQVGNPLDPSYDPSGYAPVSGIEIRSMPIPTHLPAQPSTTIETSWGRDDGE